MKNEDHVGVTFVNTIVGRGAFNGVVNLTFGVFNFTPAADSLSIDMDHCVAARLRMDMECARALHKELGDLLQKIEVEAAQLPGSEQPPTKEPKTSRVKVN